MPLAIVALLMSVAWLPIPSAVATPRWIVVGIGSCLLLCFTRVRMTTEHVLGVAFLAWCVLTILWSFSPYDTSGALLRLIVIAAAFCVAAEVRSLTAFYIALGIGASINAAIAVAQVQGVGLFDYAHQSSGIPTGAFGNKNFLANFGVLALIGALSLQGRWWWAWVIAGGSALAAFLPMSRGAMIAFAVALLVKYWQRSWNIVAGLAFMAVTGVLCIGAIYADLYFTPGRMFDSIVPRLDMWDWAISNFTWFGWGYGTFGTIFPFEHASNDFLETIFELGVGASLLLCFFAVLLTRQNGTERAILAAALVEACTAFPLHQAATLFVVAIVAGHLAGAHRRAVDNEPVGGEDRGERLSLPWPLSAREVHAAPFGG